MKKRRIKDSNIKTFSIFIIIGIIFSTVAYASITFNMTVDGDLSLRMQDGVIISDVKSSSITDTSSFQVTHYVSTLLTNTVNLTTSSSEVVLEVDIKNTDNVKYRLEGLLYDPNANSELGTYSNPDITPEITSGTNGMAVSDVINENESKKVYIKYKYTGNDFSQTNAGLLNGTIKIHFVRLYSITYVLNGGTQAANQPTYYAAGDSVTLLNPTKSRASFIGWYEEDDFSGTALTNLNGKTGNLTLYANFHTYYDIYFQIPPDWYKNQSDPDYTVKMHLYKSDDRSSYTSWPGLDMTRSSLTTPDIYTIEITDDILSTYDRVVFSNGNIPASGGETYYEIDKTKRQTVDVTFGSSQWGKIFVPEIYSNPNNANETRFFARSHQNIHYYLWNNSTNAKAAEWPGLALLDSIGDSGYKFTFDKVTYDRMIINKYNEDTNQLIAQTKNLTIPNCPDLTFSSSNYGKSYYYFFISRLFYDGSWHDLSSWENSEYSTWRANDYNVFTTTDSTVNYLNGILGPSH